MLIFNQLKNNKGTVSSALGKQLAQEALNGNEKILKEAIELANFDSDDEKSKNIRAGAAKIIEKVAEKRPDLVAPYLQNLKPALNVSETQTRWMIIHVFGLCAKLNYEIAVTALEKAKEYIRENTGVCLTGAATMYLGDIGALSPKETKKVFPILENLLKTASLNEIDWILEGFYKIFENADKNIQRKIIEHTKKYVNSSKKSQQIRANKILKKA